METAHARGRRRPRVRDGGAAARRDQAPARDRARHRRRSAGAPGGRRGQGRQLQGRAQVRRRRADIGAERKCGVAHQRPSTSRCSRPTRSRPQPRQLAHQEAVARRHGPGHRPRPIRRARERRTSIRAPRPARSAKPCAGRTSRRSTRWARTPRCRFRMPARRARRAPSTCPTTEAENGRRGRPAQNRPAGAVAVPALGVVDRFCFWLQAATSAPLTPAM